MGSKKGRRREGWLLSGQGGYKHQLLKIAEDSMNKERIKEVIDAMFLSCPKEGEFSSDIIETLNSSYEYLYSKEPRSWNHADIEREENEYFKQTGMGYFISCMNTSHKDKIKRMPDRSKATFWNIVSRVCNKDIIISFHKLIGKEVVGYVSKHV